MQQHEDAMNGGGSWLGELLKDAFLREFLQGALSEKSHLLILKKETLSILFELMTKNLSEDLDGIERFKRVKM